VNGLVLMFLSARKSSGPRYSAVLVCALTASCFNPQSVEVSTREDSSTPQRLLIDDFEDGNRAPSNGKFENWQCIQVGYNDQWQLLKCGITPLGGGSSSNYAYALDFVLADDFNENREYPSDELLTNLTVPLDASEYRNFVFDTRLIPGDLPTPTETYVRIHLSCLKLNPTGEINYDYEVGAGVVPTLEWQTHVLPIADFVQFDWLRKTTPIDEHACAKAVDVVKFELQPNLADGASTNGTLMIDNVYLQ